MSILRTVACVAVVVLAASLVSAIPISQSGNGTPNNLPAATAGYTNNPANCGQVELDIFNLGQSGTPLQDLFQYITNSGGQGVNFAATTPYIITLPTAIFNGGVDLQIILSSLQGFYSSSTGLSGPFNATIDTITVTLNGLFTITQTFNPKGNNFSFNASNTPFQGTNTSVVVNNFTVAIFQLFPAQSGLPTNGTCAVAYVLEVTNPNIRGDPQFIGLRGQSYQIHGIDGEVYNIISGSTYQLNSRFAYLTGPRPCPAMPSTGKKSSACWTHPGSYLGELGLKLKDQNVEVFISAGPAATGFSSVTVNGKSLEIGSTTNVVSFNSTHEATLTFGPWTIQVENSDMFVNLRSVSVNVRTWSELSTVHGLLGQTWSNKRYSGSVNVIEGEVDDYHVQENSVFGDSFIYNKFQ